MAYLSPSDEIQVSFDNIAVAFASKSDSQLRKTYWLFKIMNRAQIVNLGTFFIKLALKLHLPVKNLIKHTIFEQFCGGQSIRDCDQTIALLAQANIGTILDYSVEGEDTERNYDFTTSEILKTIEKATISSEIPFSVFKLSGLASTELLEKVQQKSPLSPEELGAFDIVKGRVDRLCLAAYTNNVRLFFDAEESWIQDVINEIAYTMMEKYNQEKAIVFNTYQLYRHETLDALKNAYLIAREKGYQVGAKLVRGAYMTKENMRARENNYFSPIHTSKEETDQDYNAAIEFCLEHIAHFAVCLGTHNEASCSYCVSKMKKISIAKNDNRIWFAQLLGMSDNITFNLAKQGYNTAKYVPYGPISQVMPYLIRRAQENTSITGQSSREYLLVKQEMERRGVNRL
jgi:proline dehydrogenase